MKVKSHSYTGDLMPWRGFMYETVNLIFCMLFLKKPLIHEDLLKSERSSVDFGCIFMWFFRTRWWAPLHWCMEIYKIICF